MTDDRIEHDATAANAAMEAGDTARAIERSTAVIDELTRIDGPESDGVVAWRTFRARALLEARRYREAEAEFAGLLVLRERLDGPDDPSVLRIRGNLARAIALGGHPAEALLIAGQLLTDRIRLFGEHDPQTLDARGHIANFHYLAGHKDTAIELYTDLLRDRTAVLGADHPATVRTGENLAAVRASTRRPADLDALRRRAFELEHRLGPEHERTLTAMAVLAEQLQYVDGWAESERIARYVEAARDRTLGSDHPRTLSIRSIAVRGLARRGFVAEAIAEAYDIIDRHDRHDRTDRHDEVDALGIMADIIEFSAAPAVSADLDTERLLAVWTRLLRGTAQLPPDHPLRRVVDTHRQRFDRLDGGPRG